MNNNFRQAFSEVFGKGKEEETNQDNLSETENENDTNSDVADQSPTPYEFEELEPTGETMSDKDKALIDKKAEEFAKSLGIKLGSKTNQNEVTVTEEKTDSDIEQRPQEQETLNVDEIVEVEKIEAKKSKNTIHNKNTENKQTVNYKYYDFKAKAETLDKEQNIQTVEQVKINKPNKQVTTVINNNGNNNVSNYTPSYTLKPIATTFVDGTTKIDGSITSQSNLNISGEVNGDITCGNDIFISGKIKGNVSCENFIGDKSYIEGNITSKKNLILKNNSTVVGDISADIIEVSGKITGNIISVSELSILANSAVYGDINAKSIFVEKGSIIQGKVNIKYE